MTSVLWLKELVEENWTVSSSPIDGEGDIRPSVSNVPRVLEVGGGGRIARANQVDDRPVLYIYSEGITNISPKSVGYRDEEVEFRLRGEFVTSDGRESLFGVVGSQYSGYTGEFKRILDSVRVGPAPESGPPDTANYSYLTYGGLDDNTEQRGADIWAAEWTVTFFNPARSITQ